MMVLFIKKWHELYWDMLQSDEKLQRLTEIKYFWLQNVAVVDSGQMSTSLFFHSFRIKKYLLPEDLDFISFLGLLFLIANFSFGFLWRSNLVFVLFGRIHKNFWNYDLSNFCYLVFVSNELLPFLFILKLPANTSVYCCL